VAHAYEVAACATFKLCAALAGQDRARHRHPGARKGRPTSSRAFSFCRCAARSFLSVAKPPARNL